MNQITLVMLHVFLFLIFHNTILTVCKQNQTPTSDRQKPVVRKLPQIDREIVTERKRQKKKREFPGQGSTAWPGTQPHLTLINYNLSIPLILVPDRENPALYKHSRPGSSSTSLSHTALVFSLRMCFSEHTRWEIQGCALLSVRMWSSAQNRSCCINQSWKVHSCLAALPSD